MHSSLNVPICVNISICQIQSCVFCLPMLNVLITIKSIIRKGLQYFEFRNKMEMKMPMTAQSIWIWHFIKHSCRRFHSSKSKCWTEQLTNKRSIHFHIVPFSNSISAVLQCIVDLILNFIETIGVFLKNQRCVYVVRDFTS